MRLKFFNGTIATAVLLLVSTAAVATAVKVEDPNEGRSKLDIVEASLAKASGSQVKGTVKMADAFTPADLVPVEGVSGQICFKLWVDAKKPKRSGADFLVCATADSAGTGYNAVVMRERKHSLPKFVDEAVATQTDDRTITIKFFRSAIGRPKRVRFIAEAFPASGCSSQLDCTDVAPDTSDSGNLKLRN